MTKKEFQYGYVFYGTNANEEYVLEIEAEIGDFITIGSISFCNGNSNELKQTMTRPNGCLDFLQRFSIGVKVEEKSEVKVPKYTGTRQYKYSQISRHRVK